MDLNNIYDLWNRFDNSTATEMELEMQGVRFSLKKAGAVVESNLQPIAVAAPVQTVTNEKKTTAATEGKQTSGASVKAPLVGTFYSAPAPDAKPFAEVGKQVRKGDVIGIIEAMKLMNEVIASQDGVVKEICVADGEMVEYGQVLITLE